MIPQYKRLDIQLRVFNPIYKEEDREYYDTIVTISYSRNGDTLYARFNGLRVSIPCIHSEESEDLAILILAMKDMIEHSKATMYHLFVAESDPEEIFDYPRTWNEYIREMKSKENELIKLEYIEENINRSVN